MLVCDHPIIFLPLLKRTPSSRPHRAQAPWLQCDGHLTRGLQLPYTCSLDPMGLIQEMTPLPQLQASHNFTKF